MRTHSNPIGQLDPFVNCLLNPHGQSPDPVASKPRGHFPSLKPDFFTWNKSVKSCNWVDDEVKMKCWATNRVFVRTAADVLAVLFLFVKTVNSIFYNKVIRNKLTAMKGQLFEADLGFWKYRKQICISFVSFIINC